MKATNKPRPASRLGLSAPWLSECVSLDLVFFPDDAKSWGSLPKPDCILAGCAFRGSCKSSCNVASCQLQPPVGVATATGNRG